MSENRTQIPFALSWVIFNKTKKLYKMIRLVWLKIRSESESSEFGLFKTPGNETEVKGPNTKPVQNLVLSGQKCLICPTSSSDFRCLKVSEIWTVMSQFQSVSEIGTVWELDNRF